MRVIAYHLLLAGSGPAVEVRSLLRAAGVAPDVPGDDDYRLRLAVVRAMTRLVGLGAIDWVDDGGDVVRVVDAGLLRRVCQVGVRQAAKDAAEACTPAEDDTGSAGAGS
ncbi:hypothetical protein ABZ671_01325 [Micromonospora sp. NPDC006766]|uniref:hypothetical protein n=1 Tax=Micromonospora sp. NPDC006766 TaxID=3154778 RepID=UPI0033F8D3CF